MYSFSSPVGKIGPNKQPRSRTRKEGIEERKQIEKDSKKKDAK